MTKTNRSSRHAPQAGAAAAAGAPLSVPVDTGRTSAAAGDDDDTARRSLDFSVRDLPASPSFNDDSATTIAMTARSPSSLVQCDALREFIANWSEELFGGDSGCLSEDFSSAVGHGHGASPLQAPAQTTAGGLVAAPKRKRVRRKVEIMQLHEESKVLEMKYHKLREFLKQAAPASKQQQATCRVAKQHWDVIASRERDLLSTSELKSHKLRAEYRHQRKVAMQLHSLFVKNAAALRDIRRHFRASAHYATEWQFPVPNPLQVLAGNLHIFQKMLLEITPMQQEFARVQCIVRSREQQHQSSSMQHDPHTFRDWQVREDSTNGLFVDVVDSYVLPFDRFELDSGLRRFYGEANSASALQDKNVCEYFLTTGDTFIRQSLPPYKDPKRVAPRVRLREVVRNYSDETQSVFLVVVFIEPVSEVTGEPLGALTLCEKKWTVIRGDGDKSSIVQTYYRVTRGAVHRDYESLWTRKMLTESMMPTWMASLSYVQRELEAVLIDQSTMVRKSANNNNERAVKSSVGSHWMNLAPRSHAMNANTSAFSSTIFASGLLVPWPHSVSMRISSGFFWEDELPSAERRQVDLVLEHTAQVVRVEHVLDVLEQLQDKEIASDWVHALKYDQILLLGDDFFPHGNVVSRAEARTHDMSARGVLVYLEVGERENAV